MSRVLVIDDEASIGWAFREFLGEMGHQVELAATAEEGIEKAGRQSFDAVVLDVRLPGLDGLSAMAEISSLVSFAPVIVITAFGDLETAVRAMEGGAFDYLVKPIDLDQAMSAVSRALEVPRKRSEIGSEQSIEAGSAADDTALIGQSPIMHELFKRIAMVAPTEVPVLITGESGTGKELVARAIHRHSPRRDSTFLAVNLAALNPGLIEAELFGHVRGSFTGADQNRKGLLELADGGTLLLDELGDVPLAIQVKLLRAIEHREITAVGDARPRAINVRFLAATNRRLVDQMAAGEFRQDLYFRLGVFPIDVPPLRDRRTDIPHLARHFLRRLNSSDESQPTLRDDVIAALVSRNWPGNVRELRNAVEYAAVAARGQPIHVEHLPSPRIQASPSPRGEFDAIRAQIQQQITNWTSLAAERNQKAGDQVSPLYEQLLELVEPQFLRTLLDRNRGHRTEVAQQLGIHRSTLRQKLRKYGLE